MTNKYSGLAASRKEIQVKVQVEGDYENKRIRLNNVKKINIHERRKIKFVMWKEIVKR